MKTIKTLSLALLVGFALIACKNGETLEVKTVEAETATNEKVLNPNAVYAKAEFGIEGMTCAVGCAKTIEKKLAKMDGVKSAKVDFDRRLAMVEYDKDMVTPASLTETVTKVADVYKVKNVKTVEEFSGEKKECAADCNMACCKDKEKKTACKPDCKMECCAKKA